MEVIQTQAGNSSGARAAIFFLSLSFWTSQVCVSVSARVLLSPLLRSRRLTAYLTRLRPPGRRLRHRRLDRPAGPAPELHRRPPGESSLPDTPRRNALTVCFPFSGAGPLHYRRHRVRHPALAAGKQRRVCACLWIAPEQSADVPRPGLLPSLVPSSRHLHQRAELVQHLPRAAGRQCVPSVSPSPLPSPALKTPTPPPTVMITDYMIVRKQKIQLSHLYIADSSSSYWFWHGASLPRSIVALLAHAEPPPTLLLLPPGLNLKAPLVWALSVFPSFPGFVSTISKGKIIVPTGWVHTSYLAWILGASRPASPVVTCPRVRADAHLPLVQASRFPARCGSSSTSFRRRPALARSTTLTCASKRNPSRPSTRRAAPRARRPRRPSRRRPSLVSRIRSALRAACWGSSLPRPSSLPSTSPPPPPHATRTPLLPVISLAHLPRPPRPSLYMPRPHCGCPPLDHDHPSHARGRPLTPCKPTRPSLAISPAESPPRRSFAQPTARALNPAARGEGGGGRSTWSARAARARGQRAGKGPTHEPKETKSARLAPLVLSTSLRKRTAGSAASAAET